MTIMQRDQLNELVERTYHQLAAFEARANNVLSEASAECFTEYSGDRRALAVVSGDGRHVLDIRLTHGFGDLSRPAWALADDLDEACRGIVEAINAARHVATRNSIDHLAREFPEAFELLNDLRP
ncbi:hypothetical protein [Nocardia sp. NPDC005366]|uniref:hypothetical protein n=1 Tax=Nocardia sp. NPDC005366 TaxID=3156878 RepID=UPI0033BDC63D